MSNSSGRIFQAIRSPDVLWAAAVFLIALGLRVVGIGWGLPNDRQWESLHPDEPVIRMTSKSIVPALGRFDPGFYNYGTLYLTLFRVASDVGEAYSGVGEEKTPEGAAIVARVDYLAGRVLSTISGSGTCLFVFLILRRLTGVFGAVFGGLALAFSPGHLVHSRFATVDVTAAFFMAVGIWFTFRMCSDRVGLQQDRLSLLKLGAYAGLFFGLSAGVKYVGLLGLLAVVVVCILSKDADKWKVLGLSVATGFLAFCVTTPGLFLNTSKFLEDFKYELAHTSMGHGLVFAGTNSGFIYHLANLSEGMGRLLWLFGIAGLAAALIRRHPWSVVALIFCLAYYLLIGRAEAKFFRYVIPLMPLLAIGAGWLAGQAHTNPNSRWKFGSAAGLLALGITLAAGLKYTFWMLGVDPRIEAANYLHSQSGPGDEAGLVADPWFYTPVLYPGTALGRWVSVQVRDNLMQLATKPKVLRHVGADASDRIDWDKRLLVVDRPTFVVYSSFETEGLSRLIDSKDVPNEFKVQVDHAREFLDSLNKDYTPLKTFGEDAPTIHDLMYVRPYVMIWKRK